MYTLKMVWNVIYAMKINKNYLNVIDAYLYVAQNVLINFILMKKANVQCVGYVDNILLVKKALIFIFYQIKNKLKLCSSKYTMLCCM